MAFAADDTIGFAFEEDCGLINGGEYGGAAWFGEHVGFVVEIDARAGGCLAGEVSCHNFGWTLREPVAERWDDGGRLEERVPLSELREAWEAPLRDFYGATPPMSQADGAGSRGATHA
jgi:hypothetical protein